MILDYVFFLVFVIWFLYIVIGKKRMIYNDGVLNEFIVVWCYVWDFVIMRFYVRNILWIYLVSFFCFVYIMYLVFYRFFNF